MRSAAIHFLYTLHSSTVFFRPSKSTTKQRHVLSRVWSDAFSFRHDRNSAQFLESFLTVHFYSFSAPSLSSFALLRMNESGALKYLLVVALVSMMWRLFLRPASSAPRLGNQVVRNLGLTWDFRMKVSHLLTHLSRSVSIPLSLIMTSTSW